KGEKIIVSPVIIKEMNLRGFPKKGIIQFAVDFAKNIDELPNLPGKHEKITITAREYKKAIEDYKAKMKKAWSEIAAKKQWPKTKVVKKKSARLKKLLFYLLVWIVIYLTVLYTHK